MLEKQEIEFNEYKFVLEQDLPDVGWYVTVFHGDDSVYDTLQDSKKLAIEVIYQKFGCPKDLWGK
ncbi:hypothetical protein [Kangiella sp. M94]